MHYLSEDGKNYLLVIKEMIGTWEEVVRQLLLRSVKTSVPYLCAASSKAGMRKTFPLLKPELVIPLCECVDYQVKPEQLRPDVFLTTDKRKKAGLLIQLKDMVMNDARYNSNSNNDNILGED